LPTPLGKVRPAIAAAPPTMASNYQNTKNTKSTENTKILQKWNQKKPNQIQKIKGGDCENSTPTRKGQARERKRKKARITWNC